MKKKNIFKKIVITLSIFFVLKYPYDFFITKNIYDDISSIYKYNINNKENYYYKALLHGLRFDIDKYGSNYKYDIDWWLVRTFFNKGTIRCNLVVKFYDDDNNLIHISNDIDAITEFIYIEKINNEWTIVDSEFIP